MAVTTVGSLISRVKLILQEVTSNGTRWANTELLGWLNEGYAAICNVKPYASSVTAELTCKAGTRQTIPANGLRLLEVIRNTATGTDGLSITQTTRGAIDSTRRSWHGETAALAVEQFVFNESQPKEFYVYPPALATSKIEIVYSVVPEGHAASEATNTSTEVIRLDDSYAPVLVDYMLARAYAKDAEHAANLNRSTMHYQMFLTALWSKAQIEQFEVPRPGLVASQQQVAQ